MLYRFAGSFMTPPNSKVNFTTPPMGSVDEVRPEK
jgi:hypothetical protein